MTPTVLGLNMKVAGLAVLGSPSQELSKQVLSEVVALIGMSTGGMEAQVWSYPLPSGQGGIGDTIIQPFPFLVAQPLVESIALNAAVMDTWIDHGGFYLILCSCKYFSLEPIVAYLTQLGFTVCSQGQFRLQFQQEQ